MVREETRLTNRRFLVALAIAIVLAFTLFAYAEFWPAFAFAGAFVAFSLAVLWTGSDATTMDVFRPYYCVAALLFLYSITAPMIVSTTGAAFYGEVVDPQDMTVYYLACIASIAGVAVGTLVASADADKPSVRVNSETRSNETRALIVTTLFIGVATAKNWLPSFNPAAATSYADEALALRLRWMSDSSAGLTETMLKTIPTMLVLFVATIAVFRSRVFVWRAAGGAALFGYVATSLLSGWRGSMMIGLLVVAVYIHYRVRPFRWREMVVGGLCAYVLVNGLAVARASVDPREMIRVLRDEVGDHGLGFLTLQRSGELATSSNLLRLISGIRAGESDYGWGSIALGQFAAFIPRTLMPDRPDMASEHFVKVFYPGVFESGGGYGFFMVQDGYWDFGLLGAFLYCAIYAFALERLYRSLKRNFDSDLVVLLYALLYSQLALSVVRSGLVGSVKAAMISALPALVPMAVARMRFRATPRITAAEAAT